MKSAIVTGASSGIGLAIAEKLLKCGYRVYGIGRDFSSVAFEDEDFIKISCDVTKTNELELIIKDIRKKEENIAILVNNAGVGYFGLHEEISLKNIHKMVTTNLEVPLILSKLLLRDLKKHKGYIINISSITAKKSSPIGCAYSATKAGLSHFSEGLFDEARKYGLKVVSIHPDMAKTNFYREANFREGDSEESYITPECVADAVEMIINQRNETVITDLVIRPQKHMIGKNPK